MHVSLAEFSKNQEAVVSVRKTKWKPLANHTVTTAERQRWEASGPPWSGAYDENSSQEKEAWKLTGIQDPEGFTNKWFSVSDCQVDDCFAQQHLKSTGYCWVGEAISCLWHPG